MNKSTKLLFWFIAVAGICLIVAKFVIPIFQDRVQKETSDAQDVKGKITLAYDDWIGYFPLTCNRMRKELRNQGFILDATNDGGDYPARMKKLDDGALNFSVVTVDSYVLNGATVKYPATIIAVLDKSMGGDAMVAYTNSVSSLDSFKGPSPTSPGSYMGFPKIAFTPSSPSEHLIKSLGVHFNIPELKKLRSENKTETKDAQEALKLLKAKKVSVAVLWEPNVSKALEIPGVGKIIGTESTARLVVDILVVNRDFAKKKPEVVDLVLKSYFRVLKFYSDNPDVLQKDVMSELKMREPKAVKEMLGGVSWVNLSENCQEWFGVSGSGQSFEQGLLDTIESTVSILTDCGDFNKNPLPDGDPLRIMNRQFIQQIYIRGVQNGFTNIVASAGTVTSTESSGLDRPFKAISDEQWGKLRPVGSVKVDPVKFQSGSFDLATEEKEKIDQVVERLKHYPAFRILVSGHTSLLGDAQANKDLSRERAESVVRYLSVTYNINPNRMKAVGFGGERPLMKEDGESERAFNYRLPRVEVKLLAESF